MLLLFDLDGTLLKTDKTISHKTIEAINRCKEIGHLIGISTARSESNSEKFLTQVHPDLVISSGGALEEIISFGDDYSDIGMLKMCGKGITMGNAIDAVKEIADEVIGSNDTDGIAEWLENNILK